MSETIGSSGRLRDRDFLPQPQPMTACLKYAEAAAYLKLAELAEDSISETSGSAPKAVLALAGSAPS